MRTIFLFLIEAPQLKLMFRAKEDLEVLIIKSTGSPILDAQIPISLLIPPKLVSNYPSLSIDILGPSLYNEVLPCYPFPPSCRFGGRYLRR